MVRVVNFMNPRIETRSSAIYFAKQAYDLWHYNGLKTPDLEHVDLDVIRYVFRRDGFTVALKTNGALVWACTDEQAKSKEWR